MILKIIHRYSCNVVLCVQLKTVLDGRSPTYEDPIIASKVEREYV